MGNGPANRDPGHITRAPMRRARAVQLAMLPKAPRIAGFDIHAHYQPLEEVSGDFYDFINVSPHELGIVIGDVSGHGIDAALLMGVAKKTIQLAARGQSSPREAILSAAEDLMPDLPGNLFVSVFYGVLDLRTAVLRFVSAGHMPPLLFGRNRKDAAHFLRAKGPVISTAFAGKFGQFIEEQSVPMAPGDTLLLYSDGLTEAANADGRQFEDEGLLKAAQAAKGATSREVADQVLQSLAAHVGGEPASDDLSMVLVTVAGAPAAPPAPAACDEAAAAPTTNLRLPTTTLVGRESECARLSSWLAKDGAFVTVTGLGGIGKTRLAVTVGLRMADDFPGGAWLASLAEASNADDIAVACASALGIVLSDGRPAVEAMAALLSEREPTLLILDNFEHLLEHRNVIEAWRAAAPQMRVLVTSHTALGLAGEVELRLAPLSAPARGVRTQGTAATFSNFEAVRLFVDRAREARPDFEFNDETARWVASACAHLEGIPLAIELAAGRLKTLELRELRDRLKRDTGLVRTVFMGDNAGSQVLEKTIGATFEVLSEAEKRALLQLCIFRRGFHLDAAEAVLGLPEGDERAVGLLQGLLDKNLLYSNDTPYGRRFGIFVPVREFGRRKRNQVFTPEDHNALSLRYVEYFSSFGAYWYSTYYTRHTRELLDRLQAELDNLFLAQDMAHGMGRAECAANIALAACRVTRSRGPVSQELPRLERALNGLKDIVTPLRCEILTQIGASCILQRSVEQGVEFERQAVDYARKHLGPEHLSRALSQLGHAEIFLRRGDDALAHFAEAAKAGEGHCPPVFLAYIRGLEANVYLHQGRHEECIAAVRDAEKVFRADNFLAGLESMLQMRAGVHWDMGQTEAAMECYRDAERIARKLGMMSRLCSALFNRSAAYLRLGRLDEAWGCLEQAYPIARNCGQRHIVMLARASRARILALRGNLDSARKNAEEALGSAMKIKDPLHIAAVSRLLARLELYRGDAAAALKLCGEARQAAQKGYGDAYDCAAEDIEALALAALGRVEEARSLLASAVSRVRATPRKGREAAQWAADIAFALAVANAAVEHAAGSPKTASLVAQAAKTAEEFAEHSNRSEVMQAAMANLAVLKAKAGASAAGK